MALNGTIPPSIFRLPKLTRLLLNDNQFSGELPLEISTSLQLIKLDNTKINGTLPASIFMTPNMFGIELQSNKLHGTIPSSISNCLELQLVNINSNNLKERFQSPAWINYAQLILAIIIFVEMRLCFSFQVLIFHTLIYLSIDSTLFHNWLRRPIYFLDWKYLI